MSPISPSIPTQGDPAPWGTELSDAVQDTVDHTNSNEAALALKADLVGGVVPTSQLPPLAINEVFVVASQAAMLALVAQQGDMAIRTDNGKTYVLATNSPGTLADWKELLAAGAVQSVAGKTGVVALAAADITSGTFAIARLPVATSGTSNSTQVVRADDSRLSNARTPTAHTHPASDIVSGTLALARLGTGTPAAGSYVDGGTGAWTPVPSGGGGAAPATAPAASGWFLHPGSSAAGTAGSSANATGDVMFLPIYVSEGFTADAMVVKVGAGEGGINVRLLLYSSNSAGLPETLVASTTFDGSSGGVSTSSFTPVALSPGLYWACARTDGGSTIRFDSIVNVSVRTLISASSASFDSSRMPLPMADPGTYASPASTLSAWSFSSTNSVPRIGIRRQ